MNGMAMAAYCSGEATATSDFKVGFVHVCPLTPAWYHIARPDRRIESEKKSVRAHTGWDLETDVVVGNAVFHAAMARIILPATYCRPYEPEKARVETPNGPKVSCKMSYALANCQM